MKRTLFCLIIILLFYGTLFSQTNPAGYNGIVNDNAVLVRDQPSLEGAIIGSLNKGIAVSIFGRSQNRMYYDGYDSYWLNIHHAGIEGWSYGAFINLLDSQYDMLPVTSNIKPEALIDLNYSRDLPEDELLKKEKETLRLQASRFMEYSIQEYYDSFVKVFNQSQSLRPFFLNTHTVNLFETDRFYYLSSSALSDYIQANYSENLSISQLKIRDNLSAVFYISGFKNSFGVGFSQIKSIVINIKKIENTAFTPLNGKTIIDYISFNPYSVEDIIELSWGDADFYFSLLTSGALQTRRSSLLEMILSVSTAKRGRFTPNMAR